MSSVPSPAAFEASVRDAWDTNDYDLATTLTVRELGHKILLWLFDRLRDETAGHDAFAMFAEDLWASWPKFEWRCTVRAWAYTLARNAANRDAVSARRRRNRHVPLSGAPKAAAAVARVRTETPFYQRTTVKDRFRELRRQLSEEDQTILVLRVDRNLQWTEIAHVFLRKDGGDEPDDAALRGEAARLRKRLQLIKERIRSLAAEAGLLEP